MSLVHGLNLIGLLNFFIFPCTNLLIHLHLSNYFIPGTPPGIDDLKENKIWSLSSSVV